MCELEARSGSSPPYPSPTSEKPILCEYQAVNQKKFSPSVWSERNHRSCRRQVMRSVALPVRQFLRRRPRPFLEQYRYASSFSSALNVPPAASAHYLNRRLNTSKIQRITIRTVVGFAQHVDFFLPWSWPVREQFFSPWAYRISKFASNGTFLPYRQFEFFLIFKLVLHN